MIRVVLRLILWLTIGALLLLRAGTAVTTPDGALLLGPAVFSGAALVWLMITLTMLRRRLARTRT